MPLPKISTPTFELVIPSTKKKIKYRPFLVKEEKVLVMAMESEDMEQIARAIKDVLSNCIITRGVKVEQLSTFDIEYSSNVDIKYADFKPNYGAYSGENTGIKFAYDKDVDFGY